MKSSVPFLTSELIEKRAEQALTWIRPSILKVPSLTPVTEIAEKLAVSHGVQVQLDQDLGYSERGKKILGMCQFRPLIIYVDKSLNQNENGLRFRFTLAHELGHLSLHRNLWLDPSELDMPMNQVRDDRSHVFGVHPNRTARDRLEFQANAFAAALLMPRRTLLPAVLEVQEKLGVRRRGKIYVDDQPANKIDFVKLTKEMTAIYQVSPTSLAIRLRRLGILDDRRTQTALVSRLFRVA